MMTGSTPTRTSDARRANEENAGTVRLADGLSYADATLERHSKIHGRRPDHRMDTFCTRPLTNDPYCSIWRTGCITRRRPPRKRAQPGHRIPYRLKDDA